MYKNPIFNNHTYIRNMGTTTGTPGIAQPKQHRSMWGAILSNLTFIAEIGAMIFVDGLAEVTTAGAATPVIGAGTAAALQVLIGTAGASARLGISVGIEHQVNAISTAIDFTSAWLPAGTELYKSYKLYNRSVNTYTDIVTQNIRRTVDSVKRQNENIVERALRKLGRENKRDLHNLGRGYRVKQREIKTLLKDDEGYNELSSDLRKARGRYLYQRRRTMYSFIEDGIKKVGYVESTSKVMEAKKTMMVIRGLIQDYTSPFFEAENKSYRYYLDKTLRRTRDVMDSIEQHANELKYMSNFSDFLTAEDVGEYAELRDLARTPNFIERKAFMNKWDIQKQIADNQVIRQYNLLSADELTRIGFSKRALKRYYAQQKAFFILKTLTNNMNEKDAEIFTTIFRKSRMYQFGDTTTFDFNRESQAIYEALSPQAKEMLGNSVKNIQSLIVDTLDVTTEKSRLAMSFLGSKKRFYNRYVRNIRLLDIRDSGRYVPELIYRRVIRRWQQFIKRRVDLSNFAESTAERKANRNVGRIARRIAQVDLKSGKKITITEIKKAFVKGGGVLIPRNDYLLGYKILPSTNPERDVEKHTVLFLYDPETTSAKNKVYRGRLSKNFGGKKPSMGVATTHDLEMLNTEGVNYFWRVGLKKGWFVSRGGQEAFEASNVVVGDVALFLGFIPIQALRNVLGISTVVINNLGRVAYYGKDYLKEYKKVWVRIFEKTSINRTARFLTRYVMGDSMKQWADKAFGGTSTLMGRVLYRGGRELQRFSNTTLNIFEKTNAQGKLKFRISGQDAIMRRYLQAGVNASRMTALNKGRDISSENREVNTFKFRNRKYTTTSNRAERAHRSYIRKFRQVRRIPGAFTPKNYVKTRTWGRYSIK